MPPDERDAIDDDSVTPAPPAPEAAEEKKPSAKKVATRKKKKKAAGSSAAAASGSAKPRAAARAVVRSAAPASAMPRGVRFGLIGGGLAACVGIALVATSPSVVGTWLLVGSIVALVASIHRLGRLGPEGLA